MSVLPRRFYARPVLEVARDLLGRELVWRGEGGPIGGTIVEVEAYSFRDDPASHAARGETQRNRVMFGPPGHAYVYFTYGMHHCLNVVTGAVGHAEAVLVRALHPSVGRARWRERRPDLPLARAGQGPGRVCRALGLTLRDNGLDLVRSALVVRPGRREGREALLARVRSGPRVGIRQARELPWRLWIEGDPAVSTARGSAEGPSPGRPWPAERPAHRRLTARGGRD